MALAAFYLQLRKVDTYCCKIGQKYTQEYCLDIVENEVRASLSLLVQEYRHTHTDTTDYYNPLRMHAVG